MRTYNTPGLVIASILFFLVVPHGASAIELLSAKALTKYCSTYIENPESADGQFCVHYIQGFIDGAIATDVRVMLNVEADQNHKESFTERAMRTRSPERAKWARAARYAGFCFEGPLQLQEIVGKLARKLPELSKFEDDIPARTAVYQALRISYPCQRLPGK